MNSPLSHISILDLAGETASFCSGLLSRLGAEVIKIEKPGGDPSRNTGPFYENIRNPEYSLPFWFNNAGKKGITLDLETENDRKVFRGLASKYDIIIETFPPGYLERKQLSYRNLSKTNPQLIMASVTPFGQTGPYRHFESCDLIASSAGGQAYLNGEKSSPPLIPFGQQPYFLGSLYAAAGILLAMQHRDRTGQGQYIDISLQEAVASSLGNTITRYFAENIVTGRTGKIRRDNMAGIFPCRDGNIYLSFDREWEMLLDLMAFEKFRTGLAAEKWNSPGYRVRHISNIIETITRWTEHHQTVELFELGQSMRFPWAPVKNIPELINNPQLQERDFFASVEHEILRKQFLFPGPPFKSGNAIKHDVKRAPLIGEHNSEILCEKQLLNGNKPVEQVKNNIADRMIAEKLPLEGIRILDFTWILAGPYATTMLADFGAEVIKIQHGRTANGTEQNDTYPFASLNRNKLGITLNMSLAETKEIFLRLVSKSDIVIQNFTPRVMENWGLGYEELKKANPSVIMINLSGMGITGPWRDFAALADTIEALSGFTCLSSADIDNPLVTGYPYSDTVSSLFTVIAILTAIQQRQHTGQGQSIDISEFEAICSLMGPSILEYTVNNHIPGPQGSYSTYSEAAPYGIYKCTGKDRWCAIAIYTEEQWQNLCTITGHPELANQKSYSTPHKRKRNKKHLDEIINNWTSDKTAKSVMRMLQKNKIPCSSVNNTRDLANNPQLKHRKFFKVYKHPALGEISYPSIPIKMSSTPPRYKKPSPLLGEDNINVFKSILGMDEDTISDYVDRGIIG